MSARSGEYGGCSASQKPALAIAAFITANVGVGALS